MEDERSDWVRTIMRVWEKIYELVEGCARLLFVPSILR
tara:strand:- start:16 stop:129 length:114 start_codon:yes stop_codon:yes gene_type:complete